MSQNNKILVIVNKSVFFFIISIQYDRMLYNLIQYLSIALFDEACQLKIGHMRLDPHLLHIQIYRWIFNNVTIRSTYTYYGIGRLT